MVAKTYDPNTMKVVAEYPFEVSVQSKVRITDDMIDWCDANCVHFWMLGPALPIRVFEMWTYWFSFVDDQDAMFFKMRWQ